MRPRSIKRVCVYCGSGHGTNPAYTQAAVTIGRDLAKAGMGLVYGGGSLGLMGEVAQAALDAGGEVIGIIPKFLTQHEKMLRGADDVIVTENMHERKMLMYEKSDAFIALPGGIGTLEELVEQLTWSQLGRHGKPVIVVNTNAFWQPFLALLDHMRAQQFIRKDLDVGVMVVDEASEVIAKLQRLHQKWSKEADALVTSKF
ncbi:MAG: TIGR00730 family Rossman fold protein [Pseudomonadota bacterium]